MGTLRLDLCKPALWKKVAYTTHLPAIVRADTWPEPGRSTLTGLIRPDPRRYGRAAVSTSAHGAAWGTLYGHPDPRAQSVRCATPPPRPKGYPRFKTPK